MYHKNFIGRNHCKKSEFKNLKKSFNKIFIQILNEIKLEKNVFNSLSNNYNFSFKKKDLAKYKKFKNIVVVGMGGSILGSEAIYFFLKRKIKKNLFFLNDLNPSEIKELKKVLNFKNTLFIIISKSGFTTETLTNFLMLNIIKKNSKNIILISEKKNSPLFNLSKKYHIEFIEHKSFIGGRYSVLSEVGIVPSYLMGLKIEKLRLNIKKYLRANHKRFLQDSVIKLASIYKKKQKTNVIFLNYEPKLEKFLHWCQQLLAESLGKKGKGFFPIISSAPKDHHSLLQLYLDGPKNNLYYIFSMEGKSNDKIKTKKYFNQLDYLNNKSPEIIKKAQKNALIKAFKKNKISFREFILNKGTEEVLGELFSYFILETSIIGKLVNINPYDQPAVEQVKLYTKNILMKSSKNQL